MHYKTIILGLLEQHPALHEQLRTSRTLLSTMNRTAITLKASHDSWKERIGQARPNSDPSQIASEALELAIEELRESLPSESTTDEMEPLSPDAAMAYLRRHTPPA